LAENVYSIDGHSLTHVKNRNEKEVIETIKKLRIEFPDFCPCSLCLEDVYAAALNKLPPLYTQVSSFVFPLEKTPIEDIESAVYESFKKVTENPNHS